MQTHGRTVTEPSMPVYKDSVFPDGYRVCRLLLTFVEVEEFCDGIVVKPAKRARGESARGSDKKNILRHVPGFHEPEKVRKVVVFYRAALPHSGKNDDERSVIRPRCPVPLGEYLKRNRDVPELLKGVLVRVVMIHALR